MSKRLRPGTDRLSSSIARPRARWGEARAARPREGGRVRPPLKSRYQTIQIIRGIQGKMPGQ